MAGNGWQGKGDVMEEMTERWLIANGIRYRRDDQTQEGTQLDFYLLDFDVYIEVKLALEKYGRDRVEIIYCDTFAYEHPDNRRFFCDVERWLNQPIKILKSKEYKDIFDVFRKTRFLVSREGARCTAELKKRLRYEYQQPGDIHIFGLTADEKKRERRFRVNNLGLAVEFPLIEARITKARCHTLIREAGIELPAMYKLGYKNNNCIGCVKGGIGYWNKIRRDFPEAFARMALMERELDVSINTKREKGKPRTRMFLDEMPPNIGRYESEAGIECGVSCPTRDLFK